MSVSPNGDTTELLYVSNKFLTQFWHTYSRYSKTVNTSLRSRQTNLTKETHENLADRHRAELIVMQENNKIK